MAATCGDDRFGRTGKNPRGNALSPDSDLLDPIGRRVPAGMPGAAEETAAAKVWYGRFVDHDGRKRQVRLSTDRRVAAKRLSDLETEVERRKAGILTVASDHAATPVAEHLAAYFRDALRPGNTPAYANLQRGRIERVLQGIRAGKLSDLDPGGGQAVA